MKSIRTLRLFSRRHFLLRPFLMCAVSAMAVAHAGADELSARTHLSNDRVAVGESLELEIQVTGAKGPVDAPPVNVDGLSIQYYGPSQSSQIQIVNGRFTSSSTLTHVYSVVPQRAGTFTIPAFTLSADGRTLRTLPVTLRVEPNTNTGAGGGQEAQGQLGFAEFQLPKKTVYLGETIPVTLRLYVDARVGPRLEAMPLLEGDGFTKTKLTEPRQELARKDGREYHVFAFRTAVTPSRTGTVTLGPSEIVFNAQIRENRRGRSRSLLEQMLGDDPFNDPFFNPTRVQRVVTKAPAVDLEVKPLPAEGRPKSFSGAVGQFKMSAVGSPRQLKVGEVLTMKVTINGQGNFDRINAPPIVDPTDWQLYPAKGEFQRDDEIGLSGTKTFEMAVIPEKSTNAMPTYEFAYFDPERGKYAALRAGGAPIEVTGAPVPPPPSAAPPRADDANEKPAGKSDSAAAATSPHAPAPTDILGIRYDFGRAVSSFELPHESRAFLLAQAVPLAALLGSLIWRMRRTDEASRRVGQLRRKKAQLGRQLRSANSIEEFLEAAARWVQIDTALVTGRPEHGVDATTARTSRVLDAETAGAIDELFAARAELLYAGAGRGGETATFGNEDRAKWMRALDHFEKADARR
jgi:hypothetical protein